MKKPSRNKVSRAAKAEVPKAAPTPQAKGRRKTESSNPRSARPTNGRLDRTSMGSGGSRGNASRTPAGTGPASPAHVPYDSLGATSQDPIQFPETTGPVRTFLSDEQLQEFKDLLLEKRAAATGDMRNLANEALNRKEHGFNEQSTMPMHMADLGSDNWEQEFTLGLIANEQGLVREIDEALARIQDRSYGICLATNRRIGLARLRAKPWAKYCIEYERAREEGRAR